MVYDPKINEHLMKQNQPNSHHTQSNSSTNSQSPDVSATTSKTSKIADQLINLSIVLRYTKKAIKWTNKGIKQVTYVLQGKKLQDKKSDGSFVDWIRSPQAWGIYILVVGSLLLAYRNTVIPSGHVGKLSKITPFFWTFIEESRRISIVYGLLETIIEIAKKPKPYLFPIFFATLMIGADCYSAKK